MTDDPQRYSPRGADEAITLAVDGCLALAAAGQSDMVWGHPSVRDPGGRGVWMKCSGWGLEEITGGVVHTHSPAACRFAAPDVPLRPLGHAGSLFCYPDIPRFTRTGGLIKTRELGQSLAAAPGDSVACLLPRHGIVAVGPDIPAAVMTAVLLDRACRTQLTGCSPI